MTVVTLAFH
jgi:hypothetical protein